MGTSGGSTAIPDTAIPDTGGSMRYRARHVTTYVYEDAVGSGHQLVHLAPRSLPNQRVVCARLDVQPVPAVWSPRQDYFGNEMVQFTIETRHSELVIEAECEVELFAPRRPEGGGAPWEQVRDRLETADADTVSAHEFLFDSMLVPTSVDLARYAEPSFPPGRPIVDALVDLNRRINRTSPSIPRPPP